MSFAYEFSALTSPDVNPHNSLVTDTINNNDELHPIGTQCWYKNGKLHRDDDLPAMIYPVGTECWYQDGELHRNGDLPAVIHPNGTHEFYKNGHRHRDGDLPAIFDSDGNEGFYKDGLLHRDSNLPAVKRSNGYQAWYKNDKLYRNDNLPSEILPPEKCIIFDDFMKQLKYIPQVECGYIPQMFKSFKNNEEKNVYSSDKYISEIFSLNKECKKEGEYYTSTYIVPRYGDLIWLDSFELCFLDRNLKLFDITTDVKTSLKFIDEINKNSMSLDIKQYPSLLTPFYRMEFTISVHESLFKNYPRGVNYYITHYQCFFPLEIRMKLTNPDTKVYINDNTYIYQSSFYQVNNGMLLQWQNDKDTLKINDETKLH